MSNLNVQHPVFEQVGAKDGSRLLSVGADASRHIGGGAFGGQRVFIAYLPTKFRDPLQIGSMAALHGSSNGVELRIAVPQSQQLQHPGFFLEPEKQEDLPDEIQSEIDEFSKGVGEALPTLGTLNVAKRIACAAYHCTMQPEISRDVDGALSYDLRLGNGQLLLAEIEIDGSIDVSLYDKTNQLIKRLAEATEQAVIDLIRSS